MQAEDDASPSPGLFAPSTGAGSLARKALGALIDSADARARSQDHGSLTAIAVELRDEQVPLGVDILASNHHDATRVVYMLPGGGVNFRASYTVPGDDNLARYFCERGYLVIGISPREDSIPAGQRDLSMLSAWGIAKRRADIRKVIAKVQARLGLPYEVLGHSYGAVSALDYASVYGDELARVVVLDIYTFDPRGAPGDVRRAASTHDAHERLLRAGIYADPSYADTKRIVQAAVSDPGADSGQSRLLFGYPGNFTNLSKLAFGFMLSAWMPGVHTALTLLSGDWPLRGGYVAGSYAFALDPAKDVFHFTHVELATLDQMARQLGSGLVSMAFSRDYWAVVGQTGTFTLAWEKIRAPVLWLNSELGYGHRTHGAELIRRGGNDDVTVDVIAGYGHADLLVGKRARQDVWSRILPDR